MERGSSFGTSWADQWDYGGDPSPRGRRDGGKKQSGVEKTKAAAAATGLKKVKEGTAHGFQWIKDKCQKKGGGGGGKGKGQGQGHRAGDGSGIAGY